MRQTCAAVAVRTRTIRRQQRPRATDGAPKRSFAAPLEHGMSVAEEVY
jgi:hypothetical protein